MQAPTVPDEHAPTYDLSHFTLSDMTRCGAELRKLGKGAESMEEVAGRVVGTLQAALRTPDGAKPACALVRLFVTLPYSELDPELREVAASALGTPPAETLKCLTLLGTVGDEAQWCSRHSSLGHRALPLPSEESIARSPMIAQLIRQLGVGAGSLVAAEAPLMVDRTQHTFNVFHVLDARGSPHIPAQRDFVVPYGIESVLGFGGLFPTGDLFATILFSRCRIDRDRADLFKTLALNVKVALLPFIAGRVFS